MQHWFGLTVFVLSLTLLGGCGSATIVDSENPTVTNSNENNTNDNNSNDNNSNDNNSNDNNSNDNNSNNNNSNNNNSNNNNSNDPAITLTAPTGGEVWIIGTTETVSWTSADASDIVTIEVSYDGGATWQTIASGQPPNGSYSWLIPEQPSNNARLAVEFAGGDDRDELVEPFFIARSDALVVTAPIAAAVVFPGNVIPITWVALEHTGPVDISYSTNGGGTFTTVVTDEENDGRFDWTVPAALSTAVVVRIQGAGGGPVGESGEFEIRAGQTNLLCVDGDGASTTGQPCWATPFADLQAAIDAASSGDEIWVARAVTPYPGGVVAIGNLQVYGGFLGGEASRDQRDAESHRPVLDSGGVGTTLTTADTLIFDGFHLRNGRGDFPDAGGVTSDANGVVLRDVWITSNTTTFDAAAAAVNGGDLTLEECRIADNVGEFAAPVVSRDGDLNVRDSVFANNSEVPRQGTFAGAIEVESGGTLSVDGTLFIGNVGDAGGAIGVNDADLVVVRNSVFASNTSERGSAIQVNNVTGGEVVSVYNSTFVNNVSLTGLGSIHTQDSNIDVRNCAFEGTSALAVTATGRPISVGTSVLEQTRGYIDLGGNIIGNVRLVDPSNLDFGLAPGSPGIDAGDSDFASPVDANGTPRVDDAGTADTGRGSGESFTDIGAFEFAGTTRLRISAPTGGETFVAGGQTTVSWTGAAAGTLSIEYSSDGGENTLKSPTTSTPVWAIRS